MMADEGSKLDNTDHPEGENESRPRPGENESNSSEGKQTCEPCARDQELTVASQFCQECCERLCADCAKHHRRNKMTSKHIVVELADIGNNGKETETLKHIQIKCKLHDMKKYKYICINHAVLCCSKCAILDHRQCSNIKTLSEYRESPEFKALKSKTEEVCITLSNDLKTSRNERLQCLTNTNVNEAAFRRSLADLERCLHLLVSLELKTIRIQSSKTFMTNRKQSEQQLSQILEMEDSLEVMLSATENVRHGPETEPSVIAWFELKKSLQSKTTSLETLKSAEVDKNKSVFVELDCLQQKISECLALLNNSEDFGLRVRLSDINSGFHYFYRSSKIDSKVKDLLLLENGHILLADVIGEIVVVGYPVLNVISRVKLSSAPNSMTQVDKNRVIVSLPSEKRMADLRFNGSNSSVKYIETGKSIFCVTSCNLDSSRTVFVCEQGRQGEMHYGPVNRNFSQWTTIHSYFDNVNKLCVDSTDRTIFVSQQKRHKIVGIDFNGNIKFSFTHEKLHTPLGMCMAGSEDLYVCSYGTKKVLQINVRTRQMKDILCNVDGLNGPVHVSLGKDHDLCLIDDDCYQKIKIVKFFN